MDLDVLLVDYVLDISAVWRLRWRYGLVVRVEMNFVDGVEERSDRRPRKSVLSG